MSSKSDFDLKQLRLTIPPISSSVASAVRPIADFWDACVNRQKNRQFAALHERHVRNTTWTTFTQGQIHSYCSMRMATSVSWQSAVAYFQRMPKEKNRWPGQYWIVDYRHPTCRRSRLRDRVANGCHYQLRDAIGLDLQLDLATRFFDPIAERMQAIRRATNCGKAAESLQSSYGFRSG